MSGTDQVLINALKRRHELQLEVQRLSQFIDMYNELNGTKREAVDIGGNSPKSGHLDTALAAISESAGMIRPRGRPADFARVMETILKDVNRPLQRGEFVTEMEKRGHMIPSDDKPRYLGTILWRNSDTFESVGQGYWLKGVPIPEGQIDKAMDDIFK